MHIRPAKPQDQEKLPNLIARFRVDLAALHCDSRSLDLQAAEAEAAEYQQKGFPIYVAENLAEDLTGYLVCRVDGDVLWAESLYVLPEFRRQGIASALYAEAEKLAQALGGDTLYNWVHPNNDPIIQFLKRRGYDVLNLIELRRPRSGENPKRVIQVGNHNFICELTPPARSNRGQCIPLSIQNELGSKKTPAPFRGIILALEYPDTWQGDPVHVQFTRKSSHCYRRAARHRARHLRDFRPPGRPGGAWRSRSG